MKTGHGYRYNNQTALGIKSDAARYAWVVYHLFVLISSLVGDTAILIASLKYRAINLQKAIVVIIHHIAICDLMVTTTNVNPKFVSLISNGWMFGSFLCYFTVYTGYYFHLASMLLICNMTTSKLLLVKCPLQFGTISVKKTHMLCGASWLVALTVPVAALLVALLDEQISYFSYRNFHCEFGFTSVTWYWLKPLLAVIFVFTPNCLVVVTTISLLIIAKKVARRGQESLKWQGIITTVLTATVYCISVLPSVVYDIGESIVSVDDQSSSFLIFPRHIFQNSYVIPLSQHNQQLLHL